MTLDLLRYSSEAKFCDTTARRDSKSRAQDKATAKLDNVFDSS